MNMFFRSAMTVTRASLSALHVAASIKPAPAPDYSSFQAYRVMQ